MNSTGFKVAAVTALLMLGGTSLASANVITVGGGATGTGPYDLVSNTTTPIQAYSYVNVNLSTTLSFSTIASLSAIFNDLAGGSEVGSPRIELDATNGDFFNVYLGAPPSFNSSIAVLNGYSSMNMNNGTNDSAFENTGSYVTFASLQGIYGTDQISDIALILDGGYGTNPAQHLTLSGLTINGTNLLAATAPVPEPVTISLFGAGIAGAIAMRRRKTKKN